MYKSYWGTATEVSQETTLTSTSVVTADFNGDRKPDVAAGNAVFLGNGDGTLRRNFSVLLDPVSTNLGTLHFPIAAVSGDFNHDGNPDVAAVVLDTVNSNKTTTDIDIFVGDGASNLTLTPVASGNASIPAIATADLNGDGKLDLVALTSDPVSQI